MNSSRQPLAKKITPFEIDGVTYRYRIGGIMFADTAEAAVRGYQALIELPEHARGLLIKGAKNGLFVGAISGLGNTEIHTHDDVMGAYKLQPEVLAQIASGELRIDGRSPEALMSDQITFDDVTLTFSVVPDADMTRLSLLHEVDHHLRLHSGLMAARQLQDVTGIRRPPVSFANALDPTFYTALRTELHRTYFESITTYLRINQQHSIQDISPLDRVAATLFRKPMELYFYPNVMEGYVILLTLNNREFNPDAFNRIMIDTEARWYAGHNPITSLFRNLHALHPDLPGGRTAIRYIVSNAARSTRSELSAHFSEACAIDQEITRAIAPDLYRLLGNLTNERYGLLGFSVANSNNIDASLSPTVRQIPYQRPPLISYRAPQRISYHQRPQIGYTPNIQAAEPVVEILRREPNVRLIRDTITIDVTPRPNIISRLERILPYLRRNGTVLAQRGLLLLNLYYNTREAGGSIAAGYAATRVQYAMLRAAGNYGALPLSILMIAGAMPDARDTFNQALAESRQHRVTPPELTPLEEARNIFAFGNPWGSGRGLLSDDMDFETRIRIMMGSDERRLEGLVLQRIGRFFNTVFSTATKVTIGLVKAQNPLSIGKLDGHKYHRELSPPLSANKAHEYHDETEPEIIEISEGVEECARHAKAWPALFNEFDASVPASNSAMNFANQQVRLMDCSGSQIVMNVGMGAAVMTPEFHQFLNNLNNGVVSEVVPTVNVEIPIDAPELKIAQNVFHGAEKQSAGKKDDKPPIAFISNVGIGKVGDNLGVIATIAGIAQVGVAADKAGGFIVLVSAEFGPQFWAAMGAGLGVGAAVAAALLIANIFITKHQKRVASKINSGIKSTNKDGAKINQGLQVLFNELQAGEASRNVESLLKQTENLIGYVRTRIEKEERRGGYARSQDNKKAKKAHQHTEKSYKGIVCELSTLRRSLLQEQVQLDFIKQHAAASCDELVALAKGLIVKFSTPDEAKKASDKDSQQENPNARLQYLSDHEYKLYSLIKDKKGHGHCGQHLSLEQAKEYVATGGVVQAKHKHDINKSEVSKPATTYSETEISKVAATRVIIVDRLLELVQEGRTEEAKDFLNNAQDLCSFGTSAVDLNLTGLSTLLARLTLDVQYTPAFWLGELERVRTGTVAMNDDEKLLLKSRASEQLLGHVISNAVIGNFDTSTSIILGMRIELSYLNATTENIMAKFEALKLLLGDVDKCIALMAANSQDKTRTAQLDNVIEDAVLAFEVKKDIFAHAAERRLDKAEDRAAEFAAASPDNAEAAKGYAAGIAKLKTLHERPNQELLTALAENKKSNTENVSAENEVYSSTLITWIYDDIFKSVLNGDTNSAVRDLNQLEKLEINHAALCRRYQQTIAENADITKRSEGVLLEEYSTLLEKSKNAKRTVDSEKEAENIEPHAANALAMHKTMVLGTLLGKAFDKGRRGYNREAAESLAELRRRDASLKLSTPEEDFWFSHHEQLVGVCIKPVQDAAVRFVRGFSPSTGRSIVLGALELTTTMQIIAPTSMSLALQFAHAKYRLHDLAPATRNAGLVYQQLRKDLWPYAEGYNPLNSNNYFNGAMIYTQLALKAIEYLPLRLMVSPKYVYPLERFRAGVLNYGHKGIRTVSTVTAAMQLRTAYYSANGLANLANAPLLACTVANAVFDVGCWLDYRDKAKQGKAPEYPEYYQKQEVVHSAFETVSTFAFVAWLTGGIGAMAYAFGAAKLTHSAYVVTCESTKLDINSKAMMAACSNVGYFRNLQNEFHYVSSVTISLLQATPIPELEERIKKRQEVALRKKHSGYFIYMAGDEKDSWTKIRIDGHKDFLNQLSWPTDDAIGVIEDESASQKTRKILSDIKVTHPVMREYTSKVIYLVLKGKPTNGILDGVTDGQRIVFTEEDAHYFLYYRNSLNEIEKISLAQKPAIFAELKDNPSCAIARDSEYYLDLSEFATGVMVSQWIADSTNSIDKRLALFGGLAYVSDSKDQEAANVARITHFKQRMKNDYDAGKQAAVLDATKLVTVNGRVLINEVYLLPPHAAWDLILFYRLTTIIQSPTLLLQFRDEYEVYSKLIYDSASTDEAWLQEYWPEIRKSMGQIVGYAMQQFIDAAQRAATKKEKLEYLALVTKSYQYCNDWDLLLENDDFKFAAAAICSSLNELEKATLFMSRIRDLIGLVRRKNNGTLTADALSVLDQVQSTEYNDILFRAARGELPVDDEQLLLNALNLIEKKKYSDVTTMLSNSREFLGKSVALAKLEYTSSHQMSLQTSLQMLSKEKSRSLHYWVLLESLIQRCYESTKYIPDDMKQLQLGAKLCGWRKICLDYIYKFDLEESSRANVDRIQGVLTHQIRYYLNKINSKTPNKTILDTQRQYHSFIEAGHQAMRGEISMNIFDELESMMQDASYTLVDNHERQKYLPLEVPPDGDCAFHAFGISRKKGINLLLTQVEQTEWSEALENMPNVFTIVLNDLAFSNNKVYDRSEECFIANKAEVIAYLEQLSTPKVWLPHNQANESVLDALAFALGNNLRVFVSDAKGALQLSGINIYRNDFPMIDILYTSAVGFSADGSALNHYIRLLKLTSNVVELATEQAPPQTSPRWSQRGLFHRKITSDCNTSPAARKNL